eukprot:3398737-Pleurochrysis_carterae.AAC.1
MKDSALKWVYHACEGGLGLISRALQESESSFRLRQYLLQCRFRSSIAISLHNKRAAKSASLSVRHNTA